MDIKVIRTDSNDPNFIALVKELDAYLSITDGDEHDFYHQFNHIDMLKQVVVAYEDKLAVGCGAIKKFTENTVEVKRMYVSKLHRRKQIAQKLLIELEVWAKEIGYEKCILETGIRQVEAVKLYHKCHYNVIENYGPYKGMQNSICFEKEL